MSWKLDVLHQLAQVVSGKEKFLKKKVLLSEHMSDKKVKQSSCWYGESFSGLYRRSNQPQHSLNSKQGLNPFIPLT